MKRSPSQTIASSILKELIPARYRPRARTWYFTMLPSVGRRAALAGQCRTQAHTCRRRGSPLYAFLLEKTAADIKAGGVCWTALEEYVPDRFVPVNAGPLRFMAAIHRLVFEGRLPELALHYPSAGGEKGIESIWPTFRDAVSEHQEWLRDMLRRPVQTNEVGRSRVLLGGFLLVAEETKLPLRLLELGAAAGLNLRWDHYRYEANGTAWGDARSPVRLRGEFISGRPPFELDARVAERRGCDLAPIDPCSSEGQLTLLSYVWADQRERIELLRGAFQVAAKVPAPVERADASKWLSLHLRSPTADLATVIFHTCVMQYVDHSIQDEISDTIQKAGLAAGRSSPVARLALERGSRGDELWLSIWPEGRSQLLATSDAYGRQIRWLGRRPEGDPP